MAVPSGQFPRLLGHQLLSSEEKGGLQHQDCAQLPNPSTRPEQPLVVAMFNVAMVGHVNPTFALVQELVTRGCTVHYFLPPHEAIRSAARQAGATVEAYQSGDPSDLDLESFGDFGDCATDLDRLAVWPLASTLATAEHVLARCRALGVHAVLYDPMAPHGLVAARALGVPAVSLVTYPGLGSMAGMLSNAELLERGVTLRRPLAEAFQARFGMDLGCDMLSRFQWLSHDGNLVTTSQELVAPLPAAGSAPWADEVRGAFSFTAVGCTATRSAPHVAAAAAPRAESREGRAVGSAFPSKELAGAASRGARVVYAALGTMALADRWGKDLGSLSGGNVKPGVDGKAFCQHVWGALFEAMRELGDGYHCVVSVGWQEDALDFLEGASEEVRLAQVPSNVTLRASVQQVEMLEAHAHAFVSHAGFNSLQESLIAGVPLVAVPQAVDQPANAQKIEANGWGLAFLRPMETITPVALASALRAVSLEESPFSVAVAAAGATLRGGEARAADELLAMVC